MDFLQACWAALDKHDLSTCKPLGLDLGTWFAILGVGLFAALGIFGKAILAVLKRVVRQLAHKPKPEPLPHRQAGKLFGREKDIARLDAAFRTEAPTVAVTGQGGIGKTALAEEYGRRRTNTGWYRDYILVSTKSEADMADDLRSVAKLLNVADDPKARTVIDLTYKAMAESGDRWLVILDNVDDEEDQRRVLNNLRTADRIDHLITSRVRHWHGQAVEVDLDLLPRQDAVELLSSMSGRQADNALNRLAIETLERLPLALVIAGADLRFMNIDISSYDHAFNERIREAPHGRAYEKSIYAAVTGSVERLSVDAQAFLKLAAFMEPGDIDPGHLVRGAEAVRRRGWEPLPPPLMALAESEITLRAAVAECVQHSLLSEAKWKHENTFRIHRMTQLVLRDWMGAEARKQIIGTAARIGRAQFSNNPQYDAENWPKCRRLAPHAHAIAEFCAEADGLDASYAASFINDTAIFLQTSARDWRLAVQLCKLILPVLESLYGKDSPNYASALNNLAFAQKNLSMLASEDEAAALDAEVERNLKTALTVAGSKRAQLLANLGSFYRKRGRFEEAFAALSESIQITEGFSGMDHIVGSSHGNIGVLYSDWADASADERKQTDYRNLAVTHYERALELTRKALGELDFSLVARYHNLAEGYQRLGDLERALPYAIKAAAVPLAMLQRGMIDDPNHAELQEELQLLRILLLKLDRNPGEAGMLARAATPTVLAEHAAWKQGKEQISAIEPG